MARILAVAVLLALAGCGTVPQSSVGSSVASNVAFRSGTGVVESIQDHGIATPLPSASIQGAPPGISVYDASTYNQSSYTYMSSAPADIPRVIVRMDDGTQQSLPGHLAGLRVGERVQIAADGRVTRP